MRKDIGRWVRGDVGPEMLLQYSRNAPGMLPMFSRACRNIAEHGVTEMHKPGALCTIVGVIPRETLPDHPSFKGAYFVKWDDVPDAEYIGFVLAQKLSKAP